jgi:hypothetical protein
MADKKISALTAASTPLAGTEVLPIVQSGATVKVSVANLTAGRAVATAGGSFTDNITQSTAAKGVNFTANTPAAGMTSQLLNWYEEGTWTATLGPGVTVNSGSWAATAAYTRIGRTVFWNVVQTSGNISASAGVEIFSGLPFAPARASACTYTNSAVDLAGVGLAETNSKVYVAVAITSQTALRFSGTYEV